jgi:hypothetical protein
MPEESQSIPEQSLGAPLRLPQFINTPLVEVEVVEVEPLQLPKNRLSAGE